MSTITYGRLTVTSWIDQAPYRGADRCPSCGTRIRPNMKMIALILRDIVDSSMRLKRVIFPHVVRCSGCGKLLHIKSEIVIVGMEGGMRA